MDGEATGGAATIDGVQAELGVIGSVVLDLAPELGRWLFSGAGASIIPLIQDAVASVTGSKDPAVQSAALADASRAATLRMALARIAAEQAEAASAAMAAKLVHRLTEARPATPASPTASQQVAWGAPLVSIAVLLTFAAVAMVALTRTVPAGAEPVLNLLLGTVGAMATSVVGYWVGSSAGSARKDERLATLADRG